MPISGDLIEMNDEIMGSLKPPFPKSKHP